MSVGEWTGAEAQQSAEIAREVQAATREASRADAELARARAEVDRVQAQLAAQAPDGGGQNTSITTSPDGRLTTINANGKITTIETRADGQVVIRDGGATSTFGPGPEADAVARLVQHQAHVGVPTFPQDMRRGEQIPEDVLPLVFTIFGTVAATIVLFPIARALARRMDRRTVASPPTPDVTIRLDRIEQALETMAVEMERTSEAQRYSARLLTERLPEAPTRAIQAVEHAR
jgi:hypothetical protein